MFEITFNNPYIRDVNRCLTIQIPEVSNMKRSWYVEIIIGCRQNVNPNLNPCAQIRRHSNSNMDKIRHKDPN